MHPSLLNLDLVSELNDHSAADNDPQSYPRCSRDGFLEHEASEQYAGNRKDRDVHPEQFRKIPLHHVDYHTVFVSITSVS